MQHSKQHHNNLLRSCQISFVRLPQFHLISTTDLSRKHFAQKNTQRESTAQYLSFACSPFFVLCAQRARKLFAPNKTRGYGCLFSLDLWRSPFLVAQFGKRPYRRLKIFAFFRQFQENQTNVRSQNLELHYTGSFNTTQPVAHFLSLPS